MTLWRWVVASIFATTGFLTGCNLEPEPDKNPAARPHLAAEPVVAPKIAPPDLSRWSACKILVGPVGGCRCLAFSDDGSLMVAGGRFTGRPSGRPGTYPPESGEVKVFSVQSWGLEWTNAEPQMIVRQAAFSPDGENLVYCGRPGTRVFGTKRFQQRGFIPDLNLNTISFSPNSRFLYLPWSTDSAWDMASIQPAEFFLTKTLSFMDVSRDGKELIADGEVYDTRGKKLLRAVRGELAKFSPDRSRIVSSDRDTVYCYGRSEIPVATRRFTMSMNNIAVLSDGLHYVTDENEKDATIYAIDTGKPVARLPVGVEITSVATTPSGFKVALGRKDGVIQIWEPSSSSEPARPGHP